MSSVGGVCAKLFQSLRWQGFTEGQAAGASLYLYELGEISVLLARRDGEELCCVVLAPCLQLLVCLVVSGLIQEIFWGKTVLCNASTKTVLRRILSPVGNSTHEEAAHVDWSLLGQEHVHGGGAGLAWKLVWAQCPFWGWLKLETCVG